MAGGGIVSVEQDPEKKDRYYALTGTGEKLAFHGEPGRKLFDQYSGATADAGSVLKGAIGGLVPGGGFVAEGIKNISDARSRGAPPPPIEQAPAGPPADDGAPAAGGAVSGIVGALAGPVIGGLAGRAAGTAAVPRQAQPQQAAPSPQAPQQGPAPGAQPEQQTAPQRLGPLGYSMPAKVNGREVEGPAVMTPEGVRVFVPGTPGTPGGLTGLGKQTLEHMTETERAIAEARQIQQQGAAAGTQAALEDIAAQKAYQEQREIDAFAQAQEADTEIKEIERQKQEKEIEFAKAKTMFTESRVDPDRYMKGNWLATLGMALGAFGASLRGGGPNFAQQFVEARINADIRAQELAIDLKGKKADNALADLKSTLGDLGSAKSAYKQFMTEAAAAKLSALALRTQDKQLAAKYQESAGQLMGLYAQQDQERKIANQEKIYKDRLYYRQGTAGTTGGFVVPTQESHIKAGEAWRQDEELNISRQKAAAERAAAPGEKLTEKEKTYEQIAGSVYEKTVKLVQDYGGKVVDGKIVGELNLPLDLVPGVDDKKTGNVKARVTELGSMAANMNNAGAEAGQPTKDAMTPKLGMVTNSGAEGQLQAILSGSYDAIRSIDAKRKKEAERAKAAK